MTLPKAEHILSEGDEEYLEDLVRKLIRAGYGQEPPPPKEVGLILNAEGASNLLPTGGPLTLSTRTSGTVEFPDEGPEWLFVENIYERFGDTIQILRTLPLKRREALLALLPENEAICLNLYIMGHHPEDVRLILHFNRPHVEYSIERCLSRVQPLLER